MATVADGAVEGDATLLIEVTVLSSEIGPRQRWSLLTPTSGARSLNFGAPPTPVKPVPLRISFSPQISRPVPLAVPPVWAARLDCNSRAAPPWVFAPGANTV